MATATSASPLTIGAVTIVDTFAEAFPMSATRLVITARTDEWAMTAAREFCGDATSVIGCDLEAAIERELRGEDSPDGRPGVSILGFAFSRDKLASAIVRRVGQCILTCPTTACFSGLESERDRQIVIGGQLRFFGDGYQASKVIHGRRYWRIPVMDGEFVCEDRFGTCKGVGGGNLLIVGTGTEATLEAAQQAARAIRKLPDVILPFPGGIVRSGSKVGSRYKALPASTNEAYAPTLRGRVESALPEGARAVYELVIDGLSASAVEKAMAVGLAVAAACPGVLQITAGNYGGKLGPFHFALKSLLPPQAPESTLLRS